MKYAVVTGTSSGLGLSIAQSLLNQDYIVFGGSRSDSPIEDDNFYDISLDVRSEESVEDFFSSVSEFTSQVDCLVLNAGICELSSIADSESSDFINHFQTNTLGNFHLLKYFENFIIPHQSHIITILSTAAKYAYPNVSGYTSSKFALLGLIETCKKEWREKGLRFTNLFPGAINTPLWDKMSADFSRDKMLSEDDFLEVFNFVLNAPMSIQFPDLTFIHREGFLE